MEIMTGTSGFAYKEWKGKFYPLKISPAGMLRFYSERLNSVEINNTFYHMPRESVLMSWAEQVPDGFLFALKAPQIITHRKKLHTVAEETEYFFRTLSALHEKLGPLLFQFPASFRMNLPLLRDFLGLIPAGMSCAFEFRSMSWMNDEALDLLRERGCSLCTADTDETPAEIISTAAWGYLRMRRSDYRDEDLALWLQRIRSQHWKRAFVYFKHEEEARGPEMAARFREIADAGAGQARRGSAGG